MKKPLIIVLLGLIQFCAFAQTDYQNALNNKLIIQLLEEDPIILKKLNKPIQLKKDPNGPQRYKDWINDYNTYMKEFAHHLKGNHSEMTFMKKSEKDALFDQLNKEERRKYSVVFLVCNMDRSNGAKFDTESHNWSKNTRESHLALAYNYGKKFSRAMDLYQQKSQSLSKAQLYFSIRMFAHWLPIYAEYPLIGPKDPWKVEAAENCNFISTKKVYYDKEDWHRTNKSSTPKSSFNMIEVDSAKIANLILNPDENAAIALVVSRYNRDQVAVIVDLNTYKIIAMSDPHSAYSTYYLYTEDIENFRCRE